MKRRHIKKQKTKHSALASGVQSERVLSSDKDCSTLAIELWRAEKSLAALQDNPARSSLTLAFDKMKGVLENIGVEIHDPCGERFNEGMSLSVALVEKSTKLLQGEARISETISPSVYIKGRLVSPGKVIVETGDEGGPPDGKIND